MAYRNKARGDAYHKAWVKANPDKVRKAQQRYYRGHAVEKLARLRERRKTDPGFRAHEAEIRKNYKERDPERWARLQRKHIARAKRDGKAYRAKNKEHLNRYQREYYAKNKERIHLTDRIKRARRSKKEKLRSKNKAERYLARGCCRNCPTPRMPNSGSFCEKHWFRNRAVKRLGSGTATVARGQALKAILVRQNYRCPYTGARLVTGVNASVDHIRPWARFPKQRGNLKNIEWVDLRVNHMKRDLTRKEFLEMCLRVVEYTGIGKRV